MLHPLCVCVSCVVMVAHRKLVFLFLNHTSVASVFISALPMGQFPPISSTPTLSMNWNYFEKCMFRWASEKYTIIIEEIPAASFDIWFCHKTKNKGLSHKKANVIDGEKRKCYVGKLGSVRFLNSSICIRRQPAPIRLQKTPPYLCLLLFQQVGYLLISASEARLRFWQSTLRKSAGRQWMHTKMKVFFFWEIQGGSLEDSTVWERIRWIRRINKKFRAILNLVISPVFFFFWSLWFCTAQL